MPNQFLELAKQVHAHIDRRPLFNNEAELVMANDILIDVADVLIVMSGLFLEHERPDVKSMLSIWAEKCEIRSKWYCEQGVGTMPTQEAKAWFIEALDIINKCVNLIKVTLNESNRKTQG